MTDNLVNLEEIESRCETATRGPWYSEDRHVWAEQYPPNSRIKHGWKVADTIYHAHPLSESLNTSYGVYQQYFDAEFIAHSREDISALIAEVKRLRRVLSTIAESLPGTTGDYGEYNCVDCEHMIHLAKKSL